VCNLDYDYPDLYTKKMQKCRKQTICCECRKTIEVGEIYSYVFGVYGKAVNTYKTCCYCVVGQNWLYEQCGGYLHGNLEEEIREHAEDYKRFDLYRFVVNMRHKWASGKMPILKD
jgi:hypothetical protein